MDVVGCPPGLRKLNDDDGVSRDDFPPPKSFAEWEENEALPSPMADSEDAQLERAKPGRRARAAPAGVSSPTEGLNFDDNSEEPMR